MKAFIITLILCLIGVGGYAKYDFDQKENLAHVQKQEEEAALRREETKRQEKLAEARRKEEVQQQKLAEARRKEEEAQQRKEEARRQREYEKTAEYQLTVLQGQKEEILAIESGLKNQIQLIVSTRTGYASVIQKSVTEVLEDRIKFGIHAFQYVNGRIKDNLRLIRETDAYDSKLANLQSITERGLEEAVSMERRIDAKIQMVKAVSTGASFEREISALSQKYAPYVGNIIVHPKSLKFKSLKEVWDSLPT